MVAIASLAVGLLHSGLALARAWEVVPITEFSLSYETNPDNVAEQSLEDDAYIASLKGGLRIRGNTPDSSISIDPSIRVRDDYGNDRNSQLGGIDFLLPVTSSWTGPRWQTDVDAGFTSLPSREADYQVVNPNQPLPPGGVGCDVDQFGRCQVDEVQTRWYLGPAFSYRLTERTEISLFGSYSDVRYDEARITRRFNYDYSTAGTSLAYRLHPQHRVSATASVSRYDANQPGTNFRNQTDSTSFNVGYEYQFSPTTSINASAGASFNDFSANGLLSVSGLPCLDPVTGQFILCTTKGNDSSFIGDLFLVQRYPDRITTQVGISREIQPNSDGAQVTVDTVRAFAQREIGPRLLVSAGASYLEQEAIGSETLIIRQRLDRSYSRLELGASWRLTREWTLRGQYAYYTEDYDVRSGLGPAVGVNTRNQVAEIALTYVGRPLR